MLDRSELQALTEFSGDSPVLSVYLDTDLRRRSKDALKLMFRECVKGLETESVEEEIQRIERFLDFEYAWEARGLAIFAAGARRWKTIALPMAVETQAHYADRPYLRTLLDLWDRFGHYGIALIDRENVRLFSVVYNEILSETEAFGEELKRHKQGGWASARYQRHEDHLALRNLKQAVEIIEAFCKRTHCDKMVLAGRRDILPQVREMLPNELQDHILGEFAADMQSLPKELLDRSAEIAYQADLGEERRLIAQAITAAAKGTAGTTGLADTLYALHQGNVQQLLVEESYYSAGSVCTKCGYLASQDSVTCPLCGHDALVETPDMVNLALHKALETGAEINIVRQNKELTEAGGIAAITRY